MDNVTAQATRVPLYLTSPGVVAAARAAALLPVPAPPDGRVPCRVLSGLCWTCAGVEPWDLPEFARFAVVLPWDLR